MKEIVSTITSKGQLTIPAEIRKHLAVRQGDKVSFVIADTGDVAITVLRKRIACKPRRLYPTYHA